MSALPFLALGAVVLYLVSKSQPTPTPTTPPTPGPGSGPAPPGVPPIPQPIPIPGIEWQNHCLWATAQSLASKAASGQGSAWEHALEWAGKNPPGTGNPPLVACLQTEPGSPSCQTLFAAALFLDLGSMTKERAALRADKLEAQGSVEEAACIRQTYGVNPTIVLE